MTTSTSRLSRIASDSKKRLLCLRDIDDYYADIDRRPEAVATQLVRQFSDPQPRDAEVTKQLASYKALDQRWHEWSTVKAVLSELAEAMVQ